MLPLFSRIKASALIFFSHVSFWLLFLSLLFCWSYKKIIWNSSWTFASHSDLQRWTVAVLCPCTSCMPSGKEPGVLECSKRSSSDQADFLFVSIVSLFSLDFDSSLKTERNVTTKYQSILGSGILQCWVVFANLVVKSISRMRWA